VSAHAEWRVRRAETHELAGLPELERRAGVRFDDIPELAEVPEVVTSPDQLTDALARGQVWVAVTSADDTVVGFAHASLVDDAVHLEEVDVLPAWGRRGIGEALIHAVIDDAKARDLAAVTLTTFRNVPWNLPYYTRLGFQVVEPTAMSPGLAAVVDAEAARGLPKEIRVAMRRAVRP
jgi:GNAT superfamily N-acetyltransferase